MPDNDAWKLITRGVLEIIEEDDLRKKLAKGTPLNIKLGVDPTAPDIHLGFTVVMRKLRQFQDLGHRVILIVGDYTATVGDPSGKNKTRPILTHEEVLKNAETYKQQFFKIVDPAKTKVVYNGEWFSKLDFTGVTKLMSQITVAQMLEREDFKNRYESHKPISLHEFLYPMMQAYDSVMIEADVELGGMDQKFNVLRGRELQRSMGKEAQVGLFMPILLGTDGKEKMSKSLGNYVGVNEHPQDMYHKLFKLPDSLIESYFKLLTNTPLNEIDEMISELKSGAVNPNNIKARLATDIVSQYHGENAAQKAAFDEARIHAGETIPENTPTINLSSGTYWIVKIILTANYANSSSEVRRMIENGGVIFDNKKISDSKTEVFVTQNHLIKYGKRFLKVCATEN